VSVTPEGDDAADRIRTASQQALREALGAWSPTELRTLAADLDRMVGDLLQDVALTEDDEESEVTSS
jgi:hypothetical protein